MNRRRYDNIRRIFYIGQMSWFTIDTLFALFNADSGVIPRVYRVCSAWRDIARDYIRLYRKQALSIHTTLGVDKTIYTTTHDGAKNGLFIAYGYTRVPNTIDKPGNYCLMPIEITQMCMDRRHGLGVVFENGICKLIIKYIHGRRVDSTEYEVYDIKWTQMLATQIANETLIESTQNNLQVIDHGYVKYIFAESGKILHKILVGSVINRQGANRHYDCLVSYHNGTPKFTAMVYHWLLDATYYNPNGSINMIMTRVYRGQGTQIINYDTGYKYIEDINFGARLNEVYMYDATGKMIMTNTFELNAACCNSECRKVNGHLTHCSDSRMRSEFPVMWSRIADIVELKTLREVPKPLHKTWA